MPQTKHLVILAGIIFVVLVCVTTYLFLVIPNVKDELSKKVDFQFTNEAQVYSAYVDIDDTRTRTRESFVTRLREYVESAVAKNEIVSVEPQQIIEEDVDFGESAPQGGVILLGDGGASKEPKRGSIFSCEGILTEKKETLPWIDGNYWNPVDKVTVDGSVFWENQFSMRIAEGSRIITTNGLPAHSTGVFPISPFDDAYAYRNDESAIVSQSRTYQFPKDPLVLSSPRCLPQGQIGVAQNGVALYRAIDSVGDDTRARKILDRCGGRASGNGEYHYYAESGCVFDAYYEGAESTLLGYALDGFGIFANKEKGKTLTNADLDECHGHTHQIPWDEKNVSLYHYHMTDEFPYTLGCFKGEPTKAVQ